MHAAVRAEHNYWVLGKNEEGSWDGVFMTWMERECYITGALPGVASDMNLEPHDILEGYGCCESIKIITIRSKANYCGCDQVGDSAKGFLLKNGGRDQGVGGNWSGIWAGIKRDLGLGLRRARHTTLANHFWVGGNVVVCVASSGIAALLLLLVMDIARE